MSTANRIAHSHEELLSIVRDLQRQMQELRLHQQTEGAPDTEETRTLELAQRVTDAALRHDENRYCTLFLGFTFPSPISDICRAEKPIDIMVDSPPSHDDVANLKT